jgi:hypothetical protein
LNTFGLKKTTVKLGYCCYWKGNEREVAGFFLNVLDKKIEKKKAFDLSFWGCRF